MKNWLSCPCPCACPCLSDMGCIGKQHGNLPSYMLLDGMHKGAHLQLPANRDAFLRKIGYGWILCLTPREQDILALLPASITSRNIAKALKLSCRTVER